MYNPISLEWELFRQSGPLYGENPAPCRWEDTYALFLESKGFSRGYNDRSVFLHQDCDLVDLTYVDATYLDAEGDAISWMSYNAIINKRFDYKDLEWVPTDGEPMDYLGMLMTLSNNGFRVHHVIS